MPRRLVRSLVPLVLLLLTMFSVDSASADLLPIPGAPTEPFRGGVRRAQWVFSPDERTRILDTTTYPWRSVALLLMPASQPGYYSQCTATFIGPNVLLTAAHCLYSRSDYGGYVRRVLVFPGSNGPTSSAFDSPFGGQEARNWFVTQGWANNEVGTIETAASAPYDYGLILMPDTTLGNRVGWIPVGAFSDATLIDPTLRFTITGYDGDKSPAGSQWTRSGTGFASISSLYLRYNASTYHGSSGAAVWRVADRAVVGINIAGSDTVPSPNIGRRVDQSILSFIGNICSTYGCSFSTAQEQVATPTPTPRPTSTPTSIPTATPVPRSTPVASPGSDGVLYRDDFSVNRGWYVGYDGIGRASLGGGIYDVALVVGDRSWALAAPYLPATQDVSVEVSARTVQGASGLTFGYTRSPLSFYAFEVVPSTGFAGILRYSASAGWTTLAATRSAPIAGSSNQLRVRRTQGIIEASVNGVNVLTATDLVLTGTQVGVFIDEVGTETSAETLFSYFVVSGQGSPTATQVPVASVTPIPATPTRTTSLSPTPSSGCSAYPAPGQAPCSPTPTTTPVRGRATVYLPLGARDSSQACSPYPGPGAVPCQSLSANRLKSDSEVGYTARTPS